MRVVVLAALPQESRPLLKQLGRPRRLAGEPSPTWLLRSSHLELLVVETGMGRERATRAARHVLSGPGIDLLLSVGLAGSLWPDFRLGQVVWSRELDAYDERSESLSSAGFRLGPVSGLTAFCQIHHVQAARFLTVDGVRSKAGMTGRFAQDPTVVEMESTPIAAAAHGRRVPFLGLRAISDESTQEIDWQLGSIMDRAGAVSVPKVAYSLVRRPILLGSLPRLWLSSQVAGRNLARILMGLLRLPEEDLRALAEQLQLLPMPETAEACGGSLPEPPSATPPPGEPRQPSRDFPDPERDRQVEDKHGREQHRAEHEDQREDLPPGHHVSQQVRGRGAIEAQEKRACLVSFRRVALDPVAHLSASLVAIQPGRSLMRSME